ncbi:MAG: threonine aldolase family protein [Alphaproteobacteria bacterium]
MNSHIEVDLYSDTVTQPTPGMREAIARAEVGNEQAGEDPTVNRLCDRVAALLGKEAAVYLPSGTMCNEIAYRVYCRPGDEIILDRSGHPIHFETGGPAALSGAMLHPLDGVRGMFTAAQVHDAVRAADRHQPRSRVLSVENTANMGGGAVWPLDRIRDVTAAAREHGLATHLDGARLLNAVVASGVTARDYAAPFDSAWIDFSKGLGAPVGAVLAGSSAFIDEAWRWKHQFGGAMRQAGIIAAACVYALDHHVDRLAEDHENARVFARGIAQIPGIVLDPDEIDSNMIFFDVSESGSDARAVQGRLLERGVRIGAMGVNRMRAVTHLDVDRQGVERAVEALREAVGGV